MKNIFKETDVLLKECGAVQLSGDDLVLYEHNKKSWLAAFLYWLTGLGLHRFYLGDKFSKIYGTYFAIVEILSISSDYFTSFWQQHEILYILFMFIVVITVILEIIDLLLLNPLIINHNLLLKKHIIDGALDIKDRGVYRLQETCSILVLLIVILLRVLRNIISG